MKKCLYLLIALLALGQTARAQFGGGSGTEADPYLIKTANHWNTLAEYLANNNSSYASAHYRLFNEIYVNVMVGTSDTPFSGTFDGNGNTLNPSFTNNNTNTGPFRWVNGATIKNLKVDATLTSNSQYLGGIIGVARGNTTLINCHVVWVSIIYYKGDSNTPAYFGGFVGQVMDGTTTFSGCSFNGKFYGTSATYCGGFVGYRSRSSSVIVENSLFCPFKNEFQNTGSKTFVNWVNNGGIYLDEGATIIRDSYYTSTLGEVEGERGYFINLGEGVTVSNDNIITPCGYYVAKPGALVTINGVEGMTYIVTASNNQNVTVSQNQFTMPESDVTITATTADYQINASGTEEDPYLIHNTAQLNLLATRVSEGVNYNGKYFKLTADIAVDNMIGSSEHSFSGIFDGDGHTLTFNRTTTEDYTALFRFVTNVTIKHLNVEGTVNTNHKHVAGFIAYAYGNTSTSINIIDCRSSIIINSEIFASDCCHAGFVSSIGEGCPTTIDGCYFDGEFHTSNGSQKWAGFVGHKNNNNSGYLHITNCIFNPTFLVTNTDYSYTFADFTFLGSLSTCYYTRSLGTVQGKNGYVITLDNENGFTVTSGAITCGRYLVGMPGTTITLSDGYNYTVTAYSFNGNTVTTSDVQVTNNQFTMPNGNITITATFTPLSGNGTDENPYRISSLLNWNQLTYNVNHNVEGYATAHYQLDVDIDGVSTMLGTSEHPFSGTFDGNGHTINVNITDGSEQGVAPFHYISDATIKNLIVTGSVTQTGSHPYASGLVGFTSGSNLIQNCLVRTNVTNSSNSSEGIIGGVIGYSQTSNDTLRGCVYDGELISESYKGGLVGWSDESNFTLTNNLFAGTNSGEGDFHPIGCKSEQNVSGVVTNSYYIVNPTIADNDNHSLVKNMTGKGKKSRTITGNSDVTISNITLTGDVADSYMVSGLAAFNNGGLMRGTDIYYGDANEVNLSLSYVGSNPGSYGQGFSPSAGILTGPDNGIYTLAMPDEDVTITVLFSITTLSQWNQIAGYIAAGTGTYATNHYRLDADIEGITTMMGTKDNNFRGYFYGNGHTLTVNLNSDTTYCAPFAYTYGATIMDLATAGTITTSGRYAGGVVGRNGTDNLTLLNVTSSVAITSTHEGNAFHGGLVGYAINSTFEGCAFTGSLLGESTTGCGGLLGWNTNTVNSSANFTNCLFAPASITMGTTNSKTFVKGPGDSVSNLTNCYYSQTFGSAQGKASRTVTAGSNVSIEGVALIGEVVSYNVSNLDIYDGGGIKRGANLYYGDSDQVSLTLSSTITPSTGYSVAYTSSAGTLIGSENPYTLIMPNSNVTINAQTQAAEWTGDGSADDPYVILNDAQWKTLADRVNAGEGFSGKHFRLDADINVNNMIGDVDHSFKGTFDGNGHDLDFYFITHEEFGAPFRNIHDATIKNLRVVGYIRSDAKLAGGVVGRCTGNDTIINCYVKTHLYSAIDCFNPEEDYQQFTGCDCSFGGLVGYNNAYLYIYGCVFNGSFDFNDSHSAGGFVGWSDCITYINDSYFYPRTEFEIYYPIEFKTFSRGRNVYITNSYYSCILGEAQGKERHSITTSPFVSMVQSNPPTVYNVSGITSYIKGIKYDNVFYAGQGDNVILSLSCTPALGYVTDSYTVSAGSFSGTTNPYTLNMPNSDVTISLEIADWEGNGTQESPYLIYADVQWDLLAHRVNGTNGETQNTFAGKHFKLMADITVNTMVGTDDQDESFQGIFDGNGHKLTFNYTDKANEHYCGPFRMIKNATIKRLHTAGTLKKNKKKHAAGIAGKAYGTNYIISCRSSMDIQAGIDGDGSHGGFIGDLRGGTTHFVNCLFDGKLQGTNTKKWGGFVGWVADGCTANFTNCLFNPATVNVKDDGNEDFARHDGTVNITNSYRKKNLSGSQGIDASSYSNDNLLNALGYGWQICDNKVVPIIEPQTFTGEGTESSPYLIASAADWEKLAIYVVQKDGRSSDYFQMTDDISTSTMLGTINYLTFQGDFDGAEHTLTFTKGTVDERYNQQVCAPFCQVRNASIHDLHTTGAIYTAHQMAAGIAGRTFETTTVNDCNSTMVINSSKSGDGTHGGLVSNVTSGTLTLTGCAFAGKLLGNSTNSCGGLVGWTASSASTNVINSLFVPAEVTVSGSSSMTLARGTNITIYNSYYYTTTLGETQGEQAYIINGGEGVVVDNAGTPSSSTTIGVIGYEDGIKYNNVLYASNGKNVSLNLSAADGYTLTGGFTASAGTLSGTSNPYTLLAMPSSNVTITASFTIDDWEGLGTEENPYRIYNPAQLNLLATRVNGGNDYEGKYFKLMDDIEYNPAALSFDNNGDGINESNYNAIGYVVSGGTSPQFKGNFDGNNKTISGIRSTSNKEAQGLFGLIGGWGAVDEVKNLTLTDAQFLGSKDCGGVVGYSNQGGSINNCHVTKSVVITTMGNGAQLGGIVAWNYDSNVKNCTSAATLTKEGDATVSYAGGIAGYNRGDLIDNLAVDAVVPATNYNNQGAILGSHELGALQRNYYAGCTVAGTPNATGVGCNNADITENDGAVPGNVRTVAATTVWDNPTPENPLDGWTFIASPVVEDLAPNDVTDLVANTAENYDLYRFDQTGGSNGLEWKNYKASPFILENGQGYLYATKDTKTLTFLGTTYNTAETQEVPLVYETTNSSTNMHGWNLVGNPFPRAAYVTNMSYYKMNGDGTAISATAASASDYIPPCTGVIVQASAPEQSVVFRTMAPELDGANYNHGSILMTLAQTVTTRGNASMKTLDNAIVSFNEGEQLGKFYFGSQNANIYLPQDGEDYAIVSRDVARNVSTANEVPVNFKAKENGQYTISVNPDGVEMAYLHLIDNMTGADVDVLASPSYTFTAKTTDYESRFKLVFVANNASDGSSTGSETFAFISNGNIIVNGGGVLQIIDVTGRIIVSRDGVHTVSTNGMVPGMYVLRLINGDDVKTQKIVVR